MRILRSALWITISAAVGWLTMDALSVREQAAENQGYPSPHGIALERKSLSPWQRPDRISMAWLIRLNDVMERSTVQALRRSQKDMADWPPTARQLALALNKAHLLRSMPGKATLPRSAGDQRRLAAALFDYWQDPSKDLPDDVPEAIGQLLRSGDVVAVLEALDHRGDRALDEVTRTQLVRLLADHDPERALDMFSRLLVKRERMEAWGMTIASLAKRDPEAAMRWVEALLQGRDRSSLGQALVNALDPRLVLQQLDRLTAIGYERGDLRLHSLGSWAREDPHAARSWLKQHPDPQAAAAMAEALRGKSPHLAAEILSGVEDVSDMHHIVNSVMGSYLYEDETAALDWARQLKDNRARSGALLRAANGLASEKPEQARSLLKEVAQTITEENFDVLEDSLASIERSQPGAIEELGILDRVLEQTDSESSVYVLRYYVDALAETDPGKAATVVDRLINNVEPHDARSLRIGELARHWLTVDAEAASAWFTKLPKELMAGSVDAILGNWQKSDPDAAFAWAQSHLEPGTKAHDQALPFISQFHVSQGRYDEALNTLQRWPRGDDPPQHLYRQLIQGWHQQDPGAARHAFSSLPLPEGLWERWVDR